MDKNENKIAVCPSCKIRYKVPVICEGKRLSCKKCGSSFVLGFQDQSPHSKKISPDSSIDKKETEEISHRASLLLIGKMALKYKFVSFEQIKAALLVQKQKKMSGEQIPLGEILVSQGTISQSQLNFLLSVQRMLEETQRDQKFGAIALENGFAAMKDIDRALQEQKRIFKESKTVRLIGDILVESAIITEDQRDAILLKQKRLKEKASDEEKSPDIPNNLEQVTDDVGFELMVSQNRLEAFISSKCNNSDTIGLDDIKNFLKIKGIKYGVVDDDLIIKYLKCNTVLKEPWRIAQGTLPEAGKDAEIKYYFDTDPLKVGTIREGGAIDFKGRGAIPQVTKGDLIAEKTPYVKGEPGSDVYGVPIPAPKSTDIKLKSGKGVSISENELRVFSETDGIPEISVDGRLSVLPILNIAGDVDLKTGNIDFNGAIHVSGCIQDGFSVKGDSLSTNEILESEIEIVGDIVVAGGILGSKIKIGGNVRARYIQRATIEALGDVVVENELIDSNIETAGGCIVTKGKILSSLICARKGIQAFEIGSDSSKPCALVVGVDRSTENKLERMREIIRLMEKEQEKLQNHLKELEEESIRIGKEIGEAAQAQDGAMVDLRKVKEKVKEIKASDDKEKLRQAETAVLDLESELKKMDRNMDNLFNEEERMTGEISDSKQKAKDTETEIENLNERIKDIDEWSQAEKGIPAVKVYGKIFSGSKIKAVHSGLILPKSYQNILIKEKKIKDPGGSSKWKLKVSQLT